MSEATTTKEAHLMTRAEKLRAFGEGPWLEEPDRIEWRAHGFPCLLRRVPLGVWCGYVGVPEGHPWHGKGYDDIDAEAHGGVCYAEHCDGEVCHVPEPGEPEHVFWVGFDAAHGFDLVPQMEQQIRSLPGCAHLIEGRADWNKYRDAAYMRAEVEQLAEQAEGAALGKQLGTQARKTTDELLIGALTEACGGRREDGR